MKLPPVRKRTDYSGVKPDDLVFALFHDRVMPVDALSPEGEGRVSPQEQERAAAKDTDRRDGREGKRRV